MSNMSLLSMPTSFCCLPNELLLIIWTYLGHAEAIKIFGSMKCQQYIHLLEEYCYTNINFRETSLSTFQCFCSHLFDKVRLHVKKLSLGHHRSYSQLRLFTQARPASLSLSNMFPNLQTLILYNVPQMSSDDLEPYLAMIPFIERLILEKCPLEKLSSLICSNLLDHNTASQLRSCTLLGNDRKNGYGFVLDDPIPDSYQIQQSLIHLQIYIEDLVSLKNLLRFLPKLLTLNVRITSNVTRDDNDIFVSFICPCIYLEKLVFRVYGIVRYFPSVANFVLLFRNSLLRMDLAFVHKDPDHRHSLVYIDGNVLFNKLIVNMIKLEQIHFCIDTCCLYNQYMNSIIKSFQTEYWLSMLIGCHYDRLCSVYVIFSLPYAFSEYFITTTDIMDTEFNQAGYQLNGLKPMLFRKSHIVSIHIGDNEILTPSMIRLLEQDCYRDRTIRLVPYSFYELNQNENCLLPFNYFELVPIVKNPLRKELINTTMTWLDWMPHLRTLNIDSPMLSELIPILNLHGTIDRFSSLQNLVVRQLDINQSEDTLTVVARLGGSSKLSHIRIKQYEVLNSQTINKNNNWFVSTICQICCNMLQLETMTIDFANIHSFVNHTILEELVGTDKKNCQYECVYVSENFIQFWFEK